MNKILIFFITFQYFIFCNEFPTKQKIIANFQNFIKKYNKNYITIEEYNKRFTIFENNYLELKSFPDKRNFTIGITKFFDLTIQEFRNKKLSSNMISQLKAIRNDSKELLYIESPINETFDWREKNAVTPVKNEGNCSANWAFSCTGNIEGLYAIKNQNLVAFSDQELISCTPTNDGCWDGNPINAINWLSKVDLVDGESYPFNSSNGDMGMCQIPSSPKVKVEMNGIKFIGKSVLSIKQALVSNGPLIVTLNGDPLRTYYGGIIDYDSDACDPDYLNFSSTLVGWGFKSGMYYWIAKNPWGEDWGENGYFRILMTDDEKGICGINSYVFTAIMK